MQPPTARWPRATKSDLPWVPSNAPGYVPRVTERSRKSVTLLRCTAATHAPHAVHAVHAKPTSPDPTRRKKGRIPRRTRRSGSDRIPTHKESGNAKPGSQSADCADSNPGPSLPDGEWREDLNSWFVPPRPPWPLHCHTAATLTQRIRSRERHRGTFIHAGCRGQCRSANQGARCRHVTSPRANGSAACPA